LNIANLIAGQINTKVSVESSELSADMVTQILGSLNTANTEAVQTKTIIVTILEQNTDIKTSMDELSTSLNAINLSTSSLNTTAIDKELDDTAEANGLNATKDFVDLIDLLDTFKSDYKTMKTKLENTQNSITKSTTSITEISSNLNTEKSNLNQANANMNTITDSISTIAVTDVNNIVNPVKTSIEPLSSTNSYLLYILPAILVLIIMFTALLMSSSSIMAEKESRAYFRNFITPTNEFLFMIGEYLSNLIILLFQVFIIILVLYFFLNNILATETFILTGVSLFFLGTFFIFLGMLFGYIFSTKQTVTLASISAGMVFLFFSNTILPLETLSSSIRNIIIYNPYIIGESMLKKALLFNSTFHGISHFCCTLLIFSAVILFLAVIARYTSKNSINKD
jgi:ABC-type multidrug transport system permease subunit